MSTGMLNEAVFKTSYLQLTPTIGSGNLGIENTNINTASGVSLDEHQQTLVGSVLDVGA